MLLFLFSFLECDRTISFQAGRQFRTHQQQPVAKPGRGVHWPCQEVGKWQLHGEEQAFSSLYTNGTELLIPPLPPCPNFPHSIPTMLSVHAEQLNKTGFPTIHAVVLLEGTMNLTGEPQPLVEQLMMVKRMQVWLDHRKDALSHCVCDSYWSPIAW